MHSVATNAAAAVVALVCLTHQIAAKSIISACDSEASAQVPLENMIRRNQNSISLTSIARSYSKKRFSFFASGCELKISLLCMQLLLRADGTAAPPDFLREFVANCA
jgi:hypothetical protein